MNTRDWTLLLVRGFGLYLLTLALDSVPNLFVSVYTLFALTEFKSESATELRSGYTARAVADAVHLLMYGLAGFLLVKGEPVLRWLRLHEPNPTSASDHREDAR
jgi:hypothetical protein